MSNTAKVRTTNATVPASNGDAAQQEQQSADSSASQIGTESGLSITTEIEAGGADHALASILHLLPQVLQGGSVQPLKQLVARVYPDDLLEASKFLMLMRRLRDVAEVAEREAVVESARR